MPRRNLTSCFGIMLFLGFGVPTAPAQHMYWVDGGRIGRAALDGADPAVVLVPQYPMRIALDSTAWKMYWTAPDNPDNDDGVVSRIQRANLDGNSVEVLIEYQDHMPIGIALDVVAGKMYWADPYLKQIRRANLDGSDIEDVITAGVDRPEGIALDLSAGKIYWSDWGTGKIQRANLDGSNIEDLVTTTLQSLRGIALDVGAGKIYWADSKVGKIQRANLDGSAIEELVTTTPGGPFAIALDVVAGKIYWSELGKDEILRADLDGSRIETLIGPTLGTAFGIALDLTCRVTGDDCQSNGISDTCDVLRGISTDFDNDGIPDECDSSFIPTVSNWGLVILAFVLLCAAKVQFGRRVRA